MKFRRGWFNIYFICLLAALCPACHSLGSGGSGKKQLATIRLFLETPREGSGAGTVLVTREKIPMSVERESFLDESDLSKARLIDEADGTFSIELVFDDHGAMLLEVKSIENKGRHIVIFSNFPPPGTKQDQEGAAPKPEPGKPRVSGWISAVEINGRLSNGTLVFTPDTTREEAKRIVDGLNNVAAKNKKSF